MNLIEAIIMGIVQGLTEFIPISSTGHLVFASRWTGIFDGDPAKITATMAVMQIGTLVAVFVYFWNDIVSITRCFLVENVARISGGESAPYTKDARIGWLIVIGSVPIGVIGLLFKDVIAGPDTKNLWVVGVMMIAVAILLLIAEWVGKRERDLDGFGIKDAVVVGFAQVLSLIPGASRSGSTIMGGLLIGQKREAAARFSFLLMIPAISASGLLQLIEAIEILDKSDFVALFVGTVVSGVVGYGAIWFLLAFLRKNSTAIFIIYRLIVGALLLLLLWIGVISPEVGV
jgi:undecaprenyl-diphosphatase